MPQPKSWKAYSPVAPTYPKAPYEADKADYGHMGKVKANEYKKGSGEYKKGSGEYGKGTGEYKKGSSKYGSPSKSPYKPPETDDEKEEMTSWIEIELVDEYDKPVPGEPFEVTLPDGTVYPGTLDPKGFYRIERIYPGTCQMTFPNLDKDAWEKIGGGGSRKSSDGYGKGGGQADYGKSGGQGGGYSKGGGGHGEGEGSGYSGGGGASGGGGSSDEY